MGVAGQINDEFGVAGSAARASAVVVEAAAKSDCTVVAVGPGQYRVTRRYRRSWVMPAAVVGSIFLGLGLLLLLVPKVVEEGTVTVSEDRRGVKIRLAGTVPQQFVDDVRVACAALGSAAPGSAAPAVTPAPVVGSTPIVIQSQTSQFAPAPSHVPNALPQTPITPTSWSASPVPPQPQVAAVPFVPRSIRIGHQVVPVGAGVTVGRNPLAVTELTSAALWAVDDVSLSKTHASFRSRSAIVEVCDHSSTNGTRVESPAGVVVDCVPGMWVVVPNGSAALLGDQRVVVS